MLMLILLVLKGIKCIKKYSIEIEAEKAIMQSIVRNRSDDCATLNAQTQGNESLSSLLFW